MNWSGYWAIFLASLPCRWISVPHCTWWRRNIYHLGLQGQQIQRFHLIPLFISFLVRLTIRYLPCPAKCQYESFKSHARTWASAFSPPFSLSFFVFLFPQEKQWNLSFNLIWNSVVWLMLLNFFVKIVTSTAQRYRRKEQEQELAKLSALRSNGATDRVSASMW